MYEANILLVDDETAILQLLTTILEKEGFSHITTATSAEMALSLTQQNDYDLIILDVMLPGQSGFDICPIIRKKTDCPIFFLTAKTSDLDKISGFSHGADDYITKPFNPLEVVARMKAQLRRHMKQVMPQEQKAHSSSFGRFEINRYSAEPYSKWACCRMFRPAISAITLLLRESELRIFKRRNIRESLGSTCLQWR